MTRPATEQVLAAARAVVDAFARTDTEAYFGCFAPEATFFFHTEPAILPDRAAYEALWAGWLADGWRVVECTSSDPTVITFDGGAALAHHVRTTVEVGGERDTYEERETIVFAVDEGGDLVGIHEHLSVTSPQEES